MNTIDAQLLKELFIAGANALDEKKEYVNELNVFPVPDGDTGSNMAMTTGAAVSELMKKSLIEKSETPDTNFHKTVIDYVEKNLSKNITSTDIAKALHINHSYFCRLFKKNFNLCFQNYLALCRIEKAKSLLKNTDLSVSEIALKVGFNSISYFTKIFKKEVSLTPNQYRKA